MSREINDTKPALIKSKLVNMLATISLNEINSWEHIKGKSPWVNVNFSSLADIKEQIIFVFHSKQLH